MNLLVAIDFSDITEKVLTQARILAGALSAKVCLLHVAEPNPDHMAYDYDPSAIYAIDSAEIRTSIAQKFHHDHQSLQQYAENMRTAGIDCKALMVQGSTVDMLLKEVDKLSSDMIIMGTHGKSVISQVLLGSISEDLIRKSSIPILLIPQDKR